MQPMESGMRLLEVCFSYDAILLLDANGKVLASNALARESVRERGHFRIENGELSVRDVSIDITGLVKKAAEHQRDSLISLCHPGRKPLFMSVIGVGRQSIMVNNAAAAVAIIIADPERSRRVNADIMRKLYSFTRAESQVASILMNGKVAADVARELNVTMNTVRSHIKRALGKAGARHYCELVHLLLTVPALSWTGDTAMDCSRIEPRPARADRRAELSGL